MKLYFNSLKIIIPHLKINVRIQSGLSWKQTFLIFNVYFFSALCLQNTASSQNIWYSADFNDGKMPSDMLVMDNDGNKPIYTFIKSAWQPYNKNLQSYAVISTSKYDPPGQADDWLITPEFNIGSDAILDWEAMAADPSARDGYQVLYSLGGSNVQDFQLLESIVEENIKWQKRFINLSEKGLSNENIRIAFRNNSFDKSVLFLDNIKIYSPFQYDFSIYSIDSPKWFAIQDIEISLILSVYNYGAKTINSFDLFVSINGQSPVVVPQTGLNIQSLSSQKIFYNYKPASVGNFNIKVWAANLNGNPDQNTSNDTASVLIKVYDRNKSYPRKPCLEVFTSSYCSICRGGNSNVMNVLKNHSGEYTKINYQMNEPPPGDIYYTSECGSRFNYYDTGTVPWMMVDGGWNKSSILFNQSVFIEFRNIPSFFNLYFRFDMNGEKVHVFGNITPSIDYPADRLKMFIAITEKESSKNKGDNGEIIFHDVLKKMVPDANGTTLAQVVANTPIPVDMSYTFKNEGADATFYTVEEFSDLAVVIIIQDNETKEILQSANATFVLPVEENITFCNGIEALYPNPADNVIQLQYKLEAGMKANLEIFDIMSRTVYSGNVGFGTGDSQIITINTDTLAEGFYYIKMNTSSNIYSAKFIIKR